MAHLATGRLPKPRASGHGSPHRIAETLTTDCGWLVAALGPEAAACATQLQALLAEPGAPELLALAPSAQRILRPLTRMLAIGAFALRPRPTRVAAPRREVAFHSQGFTGTWSRHRSRSPPDLPGPGAP